MEVRPGYKQTEVGPLPTDWDVVPLGENLIGRPRYGINAAAVPFSDRLPTYIRITDISPEGQFAPAEMVSVDAAGSSDYFLEDGDIVFARTGASVGKSYRYRSEDGQLVFAGFLIRVKTNPDRLLPAYLAAYVTTGPYWSWVRLMSMRSGQPGVNGNEYVQLPVPLPPLPEQQAIATALSDVDALLGGLDRLIAKKRDIKQAAMQQLLTGQTRLPGFHGEWEETRLGDIGKFKNGLNKDSSAFGHGSPFVNLMDVFGVNAISSTNHLGLVASTKMDQEVYDLGQGDVLFIRSSVKPSGVGLTAVVERDLTDTVYSGFLIRFRDKGALDSGFKKHCFYAESFRKKIIAASSVSANTNINQTSLGALTMLLPPTKAEQTAIAAVLSDMDTELAALEARRDKTRALKQAMMQELLTGRTRLV